MNLKEEIDKLPSAQVFLANFKGEKNLQFFSGEGESLILAKWLTLHKIPFDGLFCVTEYGKFWKVHEEAESKWHLIGGTNLSYLVVSSGDPTMLFWFEHNFHIFYRAYYYNANPDVIGWAKSSGYQDIIMGFRREDFYRHLDRKDDQKHFVRAFNKAIHSTGEAPTETGLRIWFPLYDLDSKMKAELLHYLSNF